uniref:ribosomal protein L16 n=1 Tax=Fushitsunagia catenata TaxID=1827018 RepID=UPI0026E23C4E|nr:ribosomal protein L16 [Fushitsunagia catenata]WJJ67917.1 ribosomal protein L16 [Fushitsunagia catenata]
MLTEKKTQKPYSYHKACPNHLLRFGKFGIKALSFSRITKKQLDLLEGILTKKLRARTNKKSFKLWNLISLNLNLTKLSLESRMGKGKGQVYTKAVFLKPGTMLFEFDKVQTQDLIEVFKFLQKKTSVKIGLITK